MKGGMQSWFNYLYNLLYLIVKHLLLSMEIFFSVIIPLYNKEQDIENTIKSVLSQTYKQFEVVVINDGSTDAGEEVVRQFIDGRIKIFSIKNSGVSVARNYGVQVSIGDYVAFLDADDYWYPYHLQNLNAIITKYPSGKWFATAYEIEHNNRLTLSMDAPLMRNGANWMGMVDNFFRNSMRDCMAWTSAVCMRKEFFNDLGNFNVSYRNGQDVDLWIRAGIKENLYFSSKISARYVFSASNRISTTHVLNKTMINFDSYEEYAKRDRWLKAYLDLNRYSFAIRYKLYNAIDLFEEQMKKIDSSSLTRRQLFLIKSPRFLLVCLMYSKFILERFGLRLRTV